MSIASRLLKIEYELKKTNKEVTVRFVNNDGSYPEQEEDNQGSSKVIKVMVDGITSDELRSWAK